MLSALPSDVIHAIVLACNDAASLAWCGSCKHFRACRPPLRVLVVGQADDVDIRESHPELRHLMAVHVSAAEGARSHSCIAALPAALASEVTHLFVAAWRDTGIDLAPEHLSSYGAKYSALRCLALAHLTRGSVEPLRPTPAACAKQLICATAATLRGLSIDAPNGFEAGDAVDIICPLGARLHYLSLLLVPSFMPAALEEELPQGGRLQCGEAEQPGGDVLVHLLDDEEQLEFLRWRRDHEVMEEAQGAGYAMETDYLRNCVDGLCVSLREPPRVYCHRPPMPLGRRPDLHGVDVDAAVAQMAAWHLALAPDAASLRWHRHTRQLWPI